MPLILHQSMGSLPSMIAFINADISLPVIPPPPALPDILGTDPSLYIGFSPSGGVDPNDDVLSKLVIQLFLDDVMSLSEFKNRLAQFPDYPVAIHLRQLRILVIVPLYDDGYCREDFFHDRCEGAERFDHEDRRYINYPQPFPRQDGYRCQNNMFNNYHPDGYQYHDHDYRHADVIMFYHYGMIDVLKNRFDRTPGVPTQSYDAQRITMYALLNAVKHNQGECQLPFGFGGFGCCVGCNSPFYCDECHSFSGMRTCRCGCECKCWCNIHAPNKDNEAHNWAWIHRK